MHTRALCLAILALLCGCGDPTSDVEPVNASVTFFVDPGSGTRDPGLITATTMTFLAVEKTGRTRLVDAWEEAAPEGSRYGRHNFPEGTTAIAVAGYYGAVLANAGWMTPADYVVGDASIHFFDVGSLRAGADRPELQVTVTP